MMIDCSLRVYEVMYGAQIIGVLQSLDFEPGSDVTPVYSIGQHNPVTYIQRGIETPTISMCLLMTREQKQNFAVMYRLLKRVDFSFNIYGEGRYKIGGRLDLNQELFAQFLDKSHSDNEVEFMIEDASLELEKEKRHGKRKSHVH